MSEKIKIFNNLTRSKEIFRPIAEGEVKFYSCGPTTYDFIHVGNARALVIGDLIHRALRAFGYKVTFVRNFTDVDDKIIDRAKERGIDPLIHSSEFVQESQVDIDSLGLLPATHSPKVSETMEEIVAMIQVLLEKGFAYEKNGEVFYNVPKFSSYGKLSKKDLKSLQHGIRVEVDDQKQHPSDFVLWKPSKEGEPAWDSPWGKGRPGWHIECSAMAKKYLGNTIDIHHGGMDLMFPHHENEIAQSESANGVSFANYWCHNEFLNFGKEKMSKSIGNVITIRQFVEKYGGEVLRQILASVHYRSVLEWTEEGVERAINDIERIHKFILSFDFAKELNIDSSADDIFLDELKLVIPKMKEELANDFNIPGALAHFFSMIRLVNREFLDENKNYAKKKKLTHVIINCIEEIISFSRETTGLVHKNPEEVLLKLNNARKNLKQNTKLNENEIERLIAERKEARTNKDWARADAIRNKFNEAGIELKDNPDGTVSWFYK